MERKLHIWKIHYADGGEPGELRNYWDPEAEDAAAEIARAAEIENQRPVASAEYLGT